MTRFISFILLMSITATLSGCGFHLKGFDQSAQLPLKVITQSSVNTASTKLVVERELVRSGATVSPLIDAELQLFLRDEVLRKRVITRDETGRAVEYELRVELSVEYKWLQEEPMTQSFEAKRLFTHDRNQLLASHQQESQYLTELRQEIARNLIRYFKHNLAPAHGN